MHRERLEQMVVMLRGLPPEKFDIAEWHTPSECGTTACAVGWACVAPVFVKQGLYLHDQAPAFQTLTGWAAVHQFFELGSHDSHFLFDADWYDRRYSTPAVEVADRVEWFLARNAEAA
jgi:hypothetical protein